MVCKTLYRDEKKSSYMVWWGLLLLMLMTSASTCLKHSRNHVRRLFLSSVQVFHEIKSTLFWDGPRGVVSLAYSVTWRKPEGSIYQFREKVGRGRWRNGGEKSAFQPPPSYPLHHRGLPLVVRLKLLLVLTYCPKPKASCLPIRLDWHMFVSQFLNGSTLKYSLVNNCYLSASEFWKIWSLT